MSVVVENTTMDHRSTADNGKTPNPLSIAIQGKGLPGMVRRVKEITGRYGITPRKIDLGFAYYVKILNQFGIGGTFPIPGVILARNHLPFVKYEGQNIEFALHGFQHVDHTRLDYEIQLAGIERGRQLFQSRGLTCTGFRGPYLRASEQTLEALRVSGFLYDSSQGIAWDVLTGAAHVAYDHVLDFYRAISAAHYPSLPRLENGLVRIPYSLPDDEAFINRLQYVDDGEERSQAWLGILEETYRLGELFVLGLHPERIHTCDTNLIKTLNAAQGRSPAVWTARLDQIARWWKARLETWIAVQELQDGTYELNVKGPEGVVVLSRGVQVNTPVDTWDDTIQKAADGPVRFQTTRRPFIGISHGSAPELEYFLKQQGYIVEKTDSPHDHGFYLDCPEFAQQDERRILREIEGGDFPLVRLGRWPGGARSALAISGDIEGYTLWDYGLRFLGR